MPAIFGVKLVGELPDWVSAKDVILEMLRRYGVSGGVGRIIEYYGPGLRCLTAMDRHVIANMGAELGATTTVFPSDEETRHFLETEGRVDDWREITADAGCGYDYEGEIDLSKLQPLIATPSSPGNVVKVGDIEGKEIYRLMSAPRPILVGAILRSRPKSFAARRFRPSYRSISIPPRGRSWKH
jgi:aconitate hydratase